MSTSHAEPKSIFQHPWRIASLVGVVANITYNLVAARLDPGARTVAEVSDSHPTLFTPAGYAFTIWGIIYGASLVYAIMALMPSQWSVRFHDRVAPWLLLTNALASLWVSLFMADQLGPATLIIIATLTCCVFMYSLASDYLILEHLSHFWRLPFGLWLGWLSVATLANIDIALSAAGFGGDSVLWTCALLLAASVVSVATAALFLDPVVPFVIAWAAAAIAVAHFEDSTLVGVVATLVALKAASLGVRLSFFSSLRIPRGEREKIERSLRYVPTHHRVQTLS